MRRLPCKWPLWATVFAFARPLFYVFHRIGKPDIFKATELAESGVVAVVLTMLVWFVYGVACLLAPRKPHNIILPKDKESK